MLSERDIQVELSDGKFTGESQHFSSLEPQSIKLKEYLTKKKQRRLDFYFNMGSIINLIIVSIYAHLAIAEKVVPDFLTFYVGIIIAYYILKKPYETE